MTGVEMQVEQVTLDPVLGAPVVILREKQGNRSIPIWIGQGEAVAIVSELRQVPMTRPSSHDLMKELIFRLRASVSHITVTGVAGGTFFAEVALSTPEGTVRVDSRPSDAIALALRVGSPIFVAQEVLESVLGSLPANEEDILSAAPRMFVATSRDYSDGFLEGLSEEDFGKWKM